jgi:hypothetical protein
MTGNTYITFFFFGRKGGMTGEQKKAGKRKMKTGDRKPRNRPWEERLETTRPAETQAFWSQPSRA